MIYSGYLSGDWLGAKLRILIKAIGLIIKTVKGEYGEGDSKQSEASS